MYCIVIQALLLGVLNATHAAVPRYLADIPKPNDLALLLRATKIWYVYIWTF